MIAEAGRNGTRLGRGDSNPREEDFQAKIACLIHGRQKRATGNGAPGRVSPEGPPSGYNALTRYPMYDKIYLEITDICNLACPFCPPTSRPGEFMPRERFLRILDRLEGQGRLLYFHLKGEPLLHPLLGDFLVMAASRGFRVSLTTNGTLLEEAADTLLGAEGIGKLSVSLHSHSGSSDVEAYWQGVSAFLDRHREKPAFPVSLRLWNRDSGELPSETARLWELVQKRYPLAGTWDDVAKRGSSLRLDEKVYLNQADRFEWPDSALPEIETTGYCHGLRNQIGILVDGTVLPCCLDSEGVMALGNILETSLGEIAGSPRATAIRDGFSRGELVEHLCRTCGYRRRFPARGGRPAEGTAGT